MLYIIITLLVAILIACPNLWVMLILKHYSKTIDDMPGNGGELAEHLITRFKLNDVQVISTKDGDHYDPVNKHVALSNDHINNKSLTAITIAAHEVGHAIQHQRRETLFTLRTKLAIAALWAQKTGALLLLGMPVIVLISKAPSAAIFMLIAGLCSMGSSVILHFLTLPVEIDASFNKALPILQEYLPENLMPAAKKILWAAALTYVSAALISLLNIGRWLTILRR